MSVDFMNPAALRARFAELGETRETVLAVSTPLRDRRDALVNDTEQQVTALDHQISEIEAGLFALDQERALIARALGGRTGEAEG